MRVRLDGSSQNRCTELVHHSWHIIFVRFVSTEFNS
jgi:hypothetical protein